MIVGLSRASVTVRRLESVDLNRSISWRAGTIYFDKEPRGEVLAELSRYTAVKVIVRDASSGCGSWEL